MATLDIQQSLTSYLWDTLTTDNTLKTAMGGTVRCYLTWAPPDCVFPYIVHRIDMGILGAWSPVARNTYYLDIWSDSPNAEEILTIRKRIMELIDGLEFSTNETTECELWREADGFIPEATEGIWHYSCQFAMKYLDDSKVGVILRR